MGFYERVIFNRLLESALDTPAIAAERAQALAPASGDVVEIGIGTGLNVPLYPPSVRTLVAVGPDASPDARAMRRAAKRGMELRYRRGDATRLPLDDASFDTAVVTFLLCTVADPEATLREVRRVLRPNGRVLLLEHVVAPAGARRTMQRLLTPVSRVINCGCRLARDTTATMRGAGFSTDGLVEYDQPAMPPLYRHLVRGIATPLAL